ncbi:S41 family peptidase [Streptomyces sp. NBC_01142]|uniref:S41 family peptidase n=1 Tax=Streptomyces sp. NBC_01142 TaxID=2975865 RepID=UPI002255101F|nr:S41 family peptidase [Streptomyces sp. NBC_01142]MCX4823295.1 S41 family peptidase [Streptomyces sp. NBC_01142]
MQFRSGSGTIGRTVAAAALLAVTAGLALPLAPAGAHAPPPVGGVWQMDGYGTVLSLDGGLLQEYQVTGVSCIKGASAKRAGGSPAAARYANGDGDVYTVRSKARPDRASVHIDGSPGDRGLRRIDALPADCLTQAPGGPVAAFDIFWQTLHENYPFFDAKGIDWNAVRDRYRPRVNPRTTDAELFAVFREMVAPLHDAHVAVLAGKTGRFVMVRPGTTMPTEELDAKVTSHIEKRDLKGAKLRQFAGGRISYAELPGGQGYLRISGFAGYSKTKGFAAQSAALDEAMDAILARESTERLRGLIIDLRINGGGSDQLGLQLAGRLTDRPYFAYAKRARNNPADPSRFTRPQPLYVQPADAPRYTGPVAVLTSGMTISAGESFTQALIDRPGRTVRIGEHTQGVFSDVMQRKLPGGWQVWLPNEEFLTRSGRTFDGPGIPPQLAEPVFTDEEFEYGRDSAFDRAVAVLGHRERP